MKMAKSLAPIHFIHIDIFKRERGENGMEGGSKHSPEPDGPKRSILMGWSFHSVILTKCSC